MKISRLFCHKWVLSGYSLPQSSCVLLVSKSMLRGKWLFFITFLTIGHQYQSISDMNGGFCDLSHHSNQHFPLSPPERHIPWIWDAILLPKDKIVELTMISRNACKFNKTAWRTIIRRYPQISDQVGGGQEENIYVPTDSSFDYVRFNSNLRGELGKGLQLNYCLCVYFRDNIEVERIRSKRIDDVEIAELSSIQIRCPLPPPSVSWNTMRVERFLSDLPEERNLPNSSKTFSVCHLKDNPDPKIHRSFPQNTSSLSSATEYDLTLCTATSRTYRPHLVEWLEYHLMLGIQHFYLYDTTLWNHPPEKSLEMTLHDYIERGLVTVIRWPYDNCVKNMASGRWINYVVPDETTGRSVSRFFQPPRAIAQTAALASCYSRFKRKTKWMAHIDDDEFLVCFLSLSNDSHSFSRHLIWVERFGIAS
jgi:hypothetical protein